MTQTGTYEVALHQGTYFLRLSGKLCFSSSVPFSEIIDLIGTTQGCKGVMADLREVSMIDSTHLGLLARLALELKKNLGKQLTIVSTGEHVPKALMMTGLQHFALLLDAHAGDMPPTESMQTLPESKRTVAEVMLEAHQTLVGLNQENENTYQDFVTMLEESMQKKGQL